MGLLQGKLLYWEIVEEGCNKASEKRICKIVRKGTERLKVEKKELQISS
jgi:hypothetical protein